MRACSVPTVTKSITHLTNLGGKLKGKRKYKTNDAGKTTRWWFVVHAQEGLLKQLEEQWEKVQLQTSWKLESCHKPALALELPLGTGLTQSQSNSDKSGVPNTIRTTTAPSEASLQESVQMTATMEAVRATVPEEEEESTSVTEDTNATMGNVSGRNNGVVWSSHCFPPRLQQCTHLKTQPNNANSSNNPFLGDQ